MRCVRSVVTGVVTTEGCVLRHARSKSQLCVQSVANRTVAGDECGGYWRLE